MGPSPSSIERWLVAAVATAIVLVGCLFPGFDKFEDTGEDAATVGDASKDRGSSSGSSGAVEDGNSGSSGSSGSSGTPTIDSGTPAREVICIPDGGRCPVPSQYCCTTIDGPQCQDVSGISAPSNCKIQGFPGAAKAFLCDGTEDCEPGQTCCFSDLEDQNGVNAKCTTGCPAGNVVCNAATLACPTGSCTGSVANGTFKVCQ